MIHSLKLNKIMGPPKTSLGRTTMRPPLPLPSPPLPRDDNTAPFSQIHC